MRARLVAGSLSAALLLACASSSEVKPPDGGSGKPVITFSVTVPAETPDGGPVWISGNQPSLGDWDPKGAQLARGADGLWTTALEFATSTPLEFKFTRGTWATVEVSARGLDVNNRVHDVVGSARLDLAVAHWADQVSGCIPTLTGNVKKHAQVGAGAATAVPARDLVVWLPPGYDTETAKRYPVLYMHDGQNTMDECTGFLNREWNADETAQQLVLAGQVAPLIIVGVYNTGDRIPEYTPVPDPGYPSGGKADAYGRYLVETVKPFIDATYRTKADAANTGVAGSSLGGLVSMYFGLTLPATFTRIGVVSPSVWWANRDIVARVNALAAKTSVRIWEDIGTAEGSGGETVDDARALRDALVAKGWALGADLKYTEVPGAGHNEAAWSARFGDVLKYLYPP